MQDPGADRRLRQVADRGAGVTGCIGLVGNIQARLRSRAGTARARLAAIEAERRDLLAG